MPVLEASHLVSTVTSGGRIAPSVPPATTELLFLFDLQILTWTEESDDPFAAPSSSLPRPSDTLLPGVTYMLRLSVHTGLSPASESVLAKSVPVRAALDLIVGSYEHAITIAEPRRDRQRREDLEGLTIDFKLTVRADCPQGDAVLVVKCREVGTSEWTDAASLSVHLAGDEPSNRERMAELCRVQLDAHPPDNVAFLHVSMRDQESYRLQGYNYRDRPIEIAAVFAQEIGLSGYVSGKVPPEIIKSRIREFSRRDNSRIILQWLRHILGQHGESLYLIIVDMTGSEMPWEMVEVADDVYIGARACVVRWLPLTNFDPVPLKITEEIISGQVITYLDRSGVQHVARQDTALTSVKGSRCATLNDLLARMKQSLEGIGLVYVNSHGVITTIDRISEDRNSRERWNALKALPSDTGSVNTVLFNLAREQGPTRPLFFVNACHSGRMMWDRNGPYGLPDVLLARSAKCYIGTIGPVGQKYADMLASRLLDAARTEPNGVRVAELLRQVRSEAVQALQEAETSQNWEDFLYAFMYIYYGNPLARLTLMKAQGGDE